MADLNDLYQEVILDHNRRPRNFRALADASHRAEGYNPLCGDRLTLYLKLEDGVIATSAFEGAGCAISKASASLMTDASREAVGRGAPAVRAFSQDDDHAARSGRSRIWASSRSLAGVREFPVRVKCASLAWHTFKAAVEREQIATTEKAGEGL